MRDRDSTPDDVDLLRARFHELVDDVQPQPDALPRLLAAARRRRSPQRGLITVAGATVAATAVFLVALVVSPGKPPQDAAPVSVAPNSYVAQPRPGVIASFDVASGRQLRQLATVAGEPKALVADGNRVYSAVSRGPAQSIVEVAPDGTQHAVQQAVDTPSPTVLTAGGGRVAYLEKGAVTVSHGSQKHRIPVPPGTRVLELALAGDGRLAALTESAGGTAINLTDDTASTLAQRKPIRPVGGCAPLAITWSGANVAALSPTACRPGSPVRVATFNPDSGEQVAAGVPFDAGPGPYEGARLSADRLGRFLVSRTGSRQWLVDGGDVRPVPAPCAPDGGCAVLPATFWG